MSCGIQSGFVSLALDYEPIPFLIHMAIVLQSAETERTLEVVEQINANSLPFDVLEKIFLFHVLSLPKRSTHFLPLHTGKPNDFIFHSAAIKLSHVSQTWRAVAISIPKLWSTIYLRRRIRYPFQVVQMYLHRAQRLPLSITVRCEWSELREPVWGILLVHAPQWKRVDFDIPHEQAVTFASLTPQRLPLLESARFGMKLSEGLFSKVHQCPSLREVDYQGISINAIYKLAPFAQLTNIALPMMSMPAVLSVVEQCPNVEVLAVLESFVLASEPILDNSTTTTAQSSSLSGEGTIVLPKLRELKFVACRNPPALFDTLTLPALQSIVIEYCHVDGLSGCMCGLEALYNMLRRSKCDIKIFSVKLCTWQRVCSAMLTQVLGAPEMQGCEVLEVGGMIEGGEVVAALSMPQLDTGLREEGLLPMLREMKLQCGMTRYHEGRIGVGEMIESRTRNEAPSVRVYGRLKKVDLVLYTRFWKGEEETLSILRRERVQRDLTLNVLTIGVTIEEDLRGKVGYVL